MRIARSIHLRVALAIAVAGGVAGLAQSAKPEPRVGALPMKDYMIHVVGYAAANIWRWQGWSNDAQGEVSLFPKNDKEWDEAESAALVLVALADGLIDEADPKNRREWRRLGREMKAAAQESADTALYRDEDRFFAAGARLYDSCRDCHRAFLPDKRGPESPKAPY